MCEYDIIYTHVKYILGQNKLATYLPIYHLIRKLAAKSSCESDIIILL